MDSSFLNKILQATKFTTNSYKIEFLPRKMGLGFYLEMESLNKEILKPILKKIRKEKDEIRKEKDENTKEKGENTNEKGENTEEFDRLKHILKKRKRS